MFKLTWKNTESGIIEYSKRTNFKAEFTTKGSKFLVNNLLTDNSEKYAKSLINDFVKENRNFLFHLIASRDILVLRDSNKFIIGQEYDFQRGREKIYGLNDESIKCQNYITPDRNITVRCISKGQERCYDLNEIQAYAKFEVM